MKNMRRIFILFLMVVILVMGISTFGSAIEKLPCSTDVKDIKIVYIGKSITYLFWQTAMAGAKVAAGQLGVNIVCHSPAAGAAFTEQVAIFDTAIGTNPDAVILGPLTADSLVPGIEKVVKEGIKVIIIDSSVNTDSYSTFVASDNVAAGKSLAKTFVELIKEKYGKAEGEIAYITEDAGVGCIEERDQGFLEGLKEYGPDLKIVAHQYGQSSVVVAMQVFQDIFTAHPNLVGVFADSEPMGTGLIRAIDVAGLSGKLVAVSFDFSEALIDALSKDTIQALLVQKPWNIGYFSVFYAVNAIEGVYVPRFVNPGATVITRANMNSPEGQASLDPLGFYKDLIEKYK
jgi:ribose transport system substrate-binding protein